MSATVLLGLGSNLGDRERHLRTALQRLGQLPGIEVLRVSPLHESTLVGDGPEQGPFLNGIAEDLFVPVFAVGRVPGWTVQVLEQMENNILIRPLTLYDGPEPRDYVPIALRAG